MATGMALGLGFDETAAGKVGIIVTEAAGNILKHARDGQVIITALDRGDRAGLEILALDRGPGLANIARCLEDGYSTTGTSGTGLGAITRLATEFDAFSAPGTGTVILARVWAGPARPAAITPDVNIGAVSLPYPGEECCGDQWAAECQPGRTLVLVADGLGHGWYAAEAAGAVVRSFRANTHRRPGAIIDAAHAAIRSTRGAAVAVAELDHDLRQIRYAGVGNISGAILSSTTRSSLVSHNGIVGHQARKFQEFLYPWPEDGLLVMHSDGLATQWKLEDYPGLGSRDPSVVAGVLYRDFSRGRDDVTIVAVRDRAGR